MGTFWSYFLEFFGLASLMGRRELAPAPIARQPERVPSRRIR